jgi:ClpX C4-type zinc finger
VTEQPSPERPRHHEWCFVCNQEVDKLGGSGGGGFGFMLSFPASWRGHLSPPIFYVHEDCARRVADPHFDFTGELQQQEKERRKAEARIAEAEVEAAGPQDEPDGNARHCAFCGKHYTQVKKFVTGSDEGEVGICGECIELLSEMNSEVQHDNAE